MNKMSCSVKPLLKKYWREKPMTERFQILSRLRQFVSEDGLTDSDGDTVFPAGNEVAGIYRAIELIEMEEQ